jgi:rhodanese-related sulfurtransferase
MAKSFKQLMDEARKDVKEISVQETNDLLARNGKQLLLDVREKDEYREGHLEGAVSLPAVFSKSRLKQRCPRNRLRS